MYSDSDISGVHSFMNSTGEGNLRKMLVNSGMPEVDFRLLLKIAKGTSESEFIEHFQSESFPNMKFSPAENKAKENFWASCKQCLRATGLLGISQAA